MNNKPPPFKGVNIGIPMIMPIEARGFIDPGSGLSLTLSQLFLRHHCFEMPFCRIALTTPPLETPIFPLS